MDGDLLGGVELWAENLKSQGFSVSVRSPLAKTLSDSSVSASLNMMGMSSSNAWQGWSEARENEIGNDASCEVAKCLRNTVSHSILTC